VIYSWVDACPVTSLPFEDHLSMSDWPEKQAPENQTSEPLAMIHTWIVSSLV